MASLSDSPINGEDLSYLDDHDALIGGMASDAAVRARRAPPREEEQQQRQPHPQAQLEQAQHRQQPGRIHIDSPHTRTDTEH